ncbi:WAP four-disulfide core domain protein 3-like [Rhinatrema bivittatum]|uniref:WAP four-disulfide core domain protein 3-like n=1 Tax=Rhinatrema bivittatum TaxID=194408 RepID=UPI00112DBDD2|nr:WAP four-disulfide core domain protein 3-like [Rhinatrema bivittatum]
MMLRLTVLSALLVLVLTHGEGPGRSENTHNSEHSKESHEEGSHEEERHCPGGASSNSTLPSCPCVVGVNCTAVDCTSDGNCTGDARCCNTTCGLKCLSLTPEKHCTADTDCSQGLVCCRGECERVCLTSLSPNKKPTGPQRSKELKKGH